MVKEQLAQLSSVFLIFSLPSSHLAQPPHWKKFVRTYAFQEKKIYANRCNDLMHYCKVWILFCNSHMQESNN